MKIQERKLNRKGDYDYSSDGIYFITINVKNRHCILCDMIDGEMVLNQYGKIVLDTWLWMGQHFSYLDLDEFVIMPDHMHGLVGIDNDNDTVGTTLGLSLLGLSLQNHNNDHNPYYHRQHNLLSKSINAFKTVSSKNIHLLGLNDFKWQRSFHDHISLNETELNIIRKYIQDNPKNWLN